MIVYLLLNQVNLKGYVGQHKGSRVSTRWDPKFNLSKVNPHLRNAVRKYGYGAFSREILNYCSTTAEMDNLENLWIVSLRTYDPAYGYNQVVGGRYCRGHTPEGKRRISEAMKRVWQARSREEHAEVMRHWWRTRTDEERLEIRRKMSLKRRGQKVRRLTVPWNKGLKGLPSARKGKKYGPQKNRCKSFPPFTEEHKQRISEGRKGYWARKRELSQRKPVKGIEYQRPEVNAADRKQPRAIGRLLGGRHACAV